MSGRETRQAARGGDLARGPAELADSIRANLDQGEANLEEISRGWDVITANIRAVKSAPWRLVRNARLLRRNRAVLSANRELLFANDRLLAENTELLWRALGMLR